LSLLENNSTFDLVGFKKASALGIIRGASSNSIQGLLTACVLGGLKFVELTLNSKGVLPLIELASNEFSDDICIGAGTVVTLLGATQAVNAGAKFIVSPTLNIDVASFCKKKKIAYFPGALSPTEIEQSWISGATMVKVFPASQMGPDYFRNILGPFNKILLMAVGGINSSNVIQYLQAGASAVAIGGSVFTPARIKNQEFGVIEKEVCEFVSVINFHCS
jgi:2-dehydro-3-deoxyphosphogluconate aldolase / (4S)-4-hydroxy-2-oxoglutarate aldolase